MVGQARDGGLTGVELSLALGVLVGAVLGLTGAGGGILAVPALVVGLGWTMQQAAPVALVAVAGGAAVGAVEGLRRQLVRYKAAMLMAASGVPFTSLGIRAAHWLPQRVLLAMFAAVMLWVAWRLFQKARSDKACDGGGDGDGNPTGAGDGHASPVGRIDPTTRRFVWSWPTAALIAGIGALTGLMTGLLGVGGGFVIVPMLRRFTHLTMHAVVATSLLVIALVGLGGVASAAWHGAQMPMGPTALFAAATAAGMLVGRKASCHVPAKTVQRGFAGLLVIVAAGMLAKAVDLGG
jgi:uncharacterized membrane protein YfcA